METREWDPARYIETKEDVIAHLEAALEENDNELLLRTIGHIARSKGMTQIANELGVTREKLYKSLSLKGRPSLETVIKLFDILGLQIKLVPKSLPVQTEAVAQ